MKKLPLTLIACLLGIAFVISFAGCGSVTEDAVNEATAPLNEQIAALNGTVASLGEEKATLKAEREILKNCLNHKHVWDGVSEIDYTWSKDLTECYATFTCQNCKSEDAQITSTSVSKTPGKPIAAFDGGVPSCELLDIKISGLTFNRDSAAYIAGINTFVVDEETPLVITVTGANFDKLSNRHDYIVAICLNDLYLIEHIKLFDDDRDIVTIIDPGTIYIELNMEDIQSIHRIYTTHKTEGIRIFKQDYTAVDMIDVCVRSADEVAMEYDENGNVIKQTEQNSDGSETIIEYNEDGDRLKKTRKRSDGYEAVWEYDENGNVIKEAEKRNDGVTFAFEYDENGNLVREIYKEINSEMIFEYDENGNCIKETYKDADGNVIGMTECEYDENGNCIKETYKDADGNVVGMTECEYDENGNVIKGTYKDADGNVIGMTEYEYDENGNVIKETYKDADGNVI